jgi:hypothetical protein
MTGRFRLTLFDVFTLVLAVALVLSVRSGSWSRPSARLERQFSVERNSGGRSALETELLSDEVLDLAHLDLAGRTVALRDRYPSPSSVRSVLRVRTDAPGLCTVTAVTADRTDAVVLAALESSYSAWWAQNRGPGVPLSELQIRARAEVFMPVPFGIATPYVIGLVAGAALYLIIRVVKRAIAS